MPISSRHLPPGTKLTIWEEPVLGRPGIEALSPRIASVFARWSVLEKKLNQLFTLVTEAEPDPRRQFDSLKGWDRKVCLIEAEAVTRVDPDLADLVKVVLRLVKSPAGRRDALAHRVWGVADDFPSCLVLLPADDQHAMAEKIVAVKAAGSCSIGIDNRPIIERSLLVSADDLDELIADLQTASERMDALLHGYFYPRFADATGRDFADFRERLASDADISGRLVNVAAARRRLARAARRGGNTP